MSNLRNHFGISEVLHLIYFPAQHVLARQFLDICPVMRAF